MNRPQSANNSLSARVRSHNWALRQAPFPQISAASIPSTVPVPVDEIAAAVAQAIGSVLPGVLSSLQSTSTAFSSYGFLNIRAA